MNDRIALPCGRDPLDVIDGDLDGRPDPHVRTCPYCQAAISEAAGQQHIADELRSAATPAPDTLLPSVMATVWAELRPGRQIPLPTETTSFATELAISSALQYALEQLPDLEIQVCRAQATENGPDPTASAPDRPLLDIEVTAAAAYRTDLLAVADTIRARATEALRVQFGLVPFRIDVDITDLYEAR